MKYSMETFSLSLQLKYYEFVLLVEQLLISLSFFLDWLWEDHQEGIYHMKYFSEAS